MANIVRCKLDGRQSVTFPVTLKKNGRFLTEPVDIIVRGFIKFQDEANPNISLYESGDYQKNSAKSLEDKTIVYPVLFTSDIITINNGRGTITLLPRSEDILSDFDTITGRGVTSSSDISQTEILETQSDAQIVIEAGKERRPYKVSIEVTIVDDNGQIFGQTVDRGSEETASSGNGLFNQESKQITSNLIIEFYSDIEWIPSIKSVLGDNDGTSEEALKAIENMSNEVAFGSSAMYDAISSSALLLSDNNIDLFRKVIYLLTDNDSNMSISTADEAIDEVNAIDGFKKVPIISGNLQIIGSDVAQTFLSAKANSTDTINLNKLGFLTGGQSVTVISEDFIDETVDIFYGEAVGSLGYGYYEFTVDLQNIVTISTITGDFSITDARSSASWEIEVSEDGYTYTSIDNIFSVTDIYTGQNVYARFIKFKVTLLTGFDSDEYLLEPDSPVLNSFQIVYNSKKVVYLFLKKQDDGLPPYQMILGTDSNALNPEQIEVGLSKSDSYNWVDYSNASQPTIDQNGKIVVPLRFSQDTEEFIQEPLRKVDRYTLKTSYGSWDPYSSVTLYDKNDTIIHSSNYRSYPREGLVVFNGSLPYDYVDGDYSIGILNGSDYKIGLKITNVSNVDDLEILGIGKMYTTGKDLLPPVDKIAPEAQEIIISPQAPNKYSAISMTYVYFDSNFEPEDISQREIKWYINGVHRSQLDNLTSWNDLSNPNDPLYQDILSFNISDLATGETAEQKARSLGESILNVGDTIYCTIKVSDGDLFSQQEKSDTATVVEGVPTISQLKIQAFNEEGAIVDRISSNNVAFVTFVLEGDTTGNQSEIIWYVDGFEFKRGIYGEAVSQDKIDHDRLYPGEVSANTGDWALKLGNEIYVQIVPSTGSSVGDSVSSDSVIVENALPEITNAVILPTTVTQFSSMTLTWDFADFDIDVLQDATQSEETIIKWFLKTPPINSSQSTIFREVTDQSLLDFITTDIANHTSVVDAAIINAGQEWYAELTPFDGFDDGTKVIAGPKTIRTG